MKGLTDRAAKQAMLPDYEFDSVDLTESKSICYDVVVLNAVRIPDFPAKFTKCSAKLTKLSANRKVHCSARIPTAEAYIIPL